MVKFINRLTGGEMFVSDDRVEEYKAAGHRLASAYSDEGAPVKKAVSAKDPAKNAEKQPAKKAAGKKK